MHQLNIVNLWSLVKIPEKFSLIGHSSEITCLLFLNDSKYLLSGSVDSKLKSGTSTVELNI